MSSLREDAEYLRVALAMGLIDNGLAIAWADRMVMELEKPPLELIDVSSATKQPRDELMRLLAKVPGAGDLSRVAREALWLLRERFEAGEIPLETAVEMIAAFATFAESPSTEWAAADALSELL